MKGRLFWRTFSAILTAMLITVFIFSLLLMGSLQHSRQIAYENEVRLQAEEVAMYMRTRNTLSTLRANRTMEYVLSSKITEIYQKYNADIWIVNYNDFGYLTVSYLDKKWNTSENITDKNVIEQLSLMTAGESVRLENLFPELGAEIVTIGVPWTYGDNQIVGAVLLHISTDELSVGFDEVLPQILPMAGIAAIIGLFVSLFLARQQTQPIREINDAVIEFSKGDLSRRVALDCGGELQDLGDSINRMASELSQMEQSRRGFVAAVSHELRSPMTCIRGYVEALLDGTIAGADAPQYLNIVLDETNRLTALVNDLLDLSRMESGRFPMKLAPFDANELVRRILIAFEKRISAKNIEVEVVMAADPCYVMGDMGRINQVISNFVDNAVKFLPEAGGKLTVRTDTVGKNVAFTVANNGPVIAEADLPHIFERFYKADKAHTSGKGTGLGLSISNTIIREHKSKIEVRSEEGETSFRFELQASDCPEKRPSAKELSIE